MAVTMYAVREFMSRRYPKKGKKRNRKQEQQPQSTNQENEFPSFSESSIQHTYDIIQYGST
jgi:hypothetical protein